jgi:hypothetical protein
MMDGGVVCVKKSGNAGEKIQNRKSGNNVIFKMGLYILPVKYISQIDLFIRHYCKLH